MTVEMTYMMMMCIVESVLFTSILRNEIMVFVHYSNTARGYNLDIH